MNQPSSPTAATVYPPQTARFYVDLSVFWFAISFLWSGMVSVVMQELVLSMVGRRRDQVLGPTLAGGALVAMVVVIVAGTVSDRSRWRLGRRRPCLILGTVLAVPALLAVAAAGSIGSLVAAFCAVQLWVNVATAPYQAMLPDMVPKERQGTAAAYMGMMSLLGQLGGILVCGLVIGRPGGVWVVMGGLAALLLATMVYTVVRLPEPSAVDNLLPQVGLVGTVVESFRVRPRDHPDFFLLILSRGIINLGFYSVTYAMDYYVKFSLRSPRPESMFVLIMALATVSGLFGNIPAGLLADRMSKKKLVYIAMAITSVAAVSFVLASSLVPALVAAVVFGAGFGAFMAVDWAFATNLLPEQDEAKYMGIWNVASAVPQVIAPLVGGCLAGHFNRVVEGPGYRVVLATVVVYCIVGVLCMVPIRERVVHRPEATA